MTSLKTRMTKNVRGILRDALPSTDDILDMVVKSKPVVMQRSICLMCGNEFGKDRAEVTGWRKLHIAKWWYNQSELEITQPVLCVRQLRRVESHRNWLVFVFPLIILLYWCQGLCLPPSPRFLTEPSGAQSSSELVSGPTNMSVNPKLWDVDVSEAFSPPGWVSYFIMKFSRGPLWRLSSCTLLKTGEHTVLFFPLSPLLEYWLC